MQVPAERPLENGARTAMSGPPRLELDGLDGSPSALVHAASRCRERISVLRSASTGQIAVCFGDGVDVPPGFDAIALSLPRLPRVARLLRVPRDASGPVSLRQRRDGPRDREPAPGAGDGARRAALLLRLGGGRSGRRGDERRRNPARARGTSDASWGSDLIHTPHDPSLEEKLVELYLRHGVRRVSASAFMRLTPAVVRYACTGLSLAADGTIRRENHLFAKLSRPETARLFMSPAAGRRSSRRSSQRGPALGSRSERSRPTSRSPRTSPSRPIRAATPTTGRSTALLPTIFALRAELQTRARLRAAAARRRRRRHRDARAPSPPPSRWARPTW